MLSKRSIIVALTGLNLLLLAALILSSYSPPAAFAQGRGRPGDFMMATCQIHSDYDALAVFNTQKGMMYTFVPRESSGAFKLVPTGFRNMARDFGR